MTNTSDANLPSQEYWDAVYSDVNYKVSKAIGKYVLLILVIIGSVGNLLSFAVMIRRTMRSSSTAFYMASLALADTMVLLIGCLRRWVIAVFDEDLLNVGGQVTCSTVNFIQYWSFDVAVWILVVMTIDRAIVVIIPLKAYIYATRGRAIIALVSIIIVCGGINAHFFFTTEFVDKICTGKRIYPVFWEAWRWIDASVYSFLPFTLLLIMNIIIIIALSKADAKKRRMTDHFQKRRRSSQAGVNSRKLSLMLLSVSSAFILLTAPTVILDILREVGPPFFDLESASDMAKYILTKQISRVLLYTNHSINFFLYCITGSKFRKELAAMLHCLGKANKRRGTIVSIANGSVTNEGYLSGTPERESSM